MITKETIHIMYDLDLKDKRILSTLTSLRIETLDFEVITRTLIEGLLASGYYLEFNVTRSYSELIDLPTDELLCIDSTSELDPLNYFNVIKETDHIVLERIVNTGDKVCEYRIPFDRLELEPQSSIRSPLVKITGDDTDVYWLFTDLIVRVVDLYLERLCNLPAHLYDDARKPKSNTDNVFSITSKGSNVNSPV